MLERSNGVNVGLKPLKHLRETLAPALNNFSELTSLSYPLLFLLIDLYL